MSSVASPLPLPLRFSRFLFRNFPTPPNLIIFIIERNFPFPNTIHELSGPSSSRRSASSQGAILSSFRFSRFHFYSFFRLLIKPNPRANHAYQFVINFLSPISKLRSLTISHLRFVQNNFVIYSLSGEDCNDARDLRELKSCSLLIAVTRSYKQQDTPH